MILHILGSFLAAYGFGVMFNIKGKKLFAAAFGGAFGYVLHDFCTNAGLSDSLSMFLASAGFTIYAEILARKMRTPVTLFIVCALIILVPGGGMYRTMLAIIQNRLNDATSIGLSTLASAGSLALGTIFVSSVTKSITIMKKRG